MDADPHLMISFTLTDDGWELQKVSWRQAIKRKT